MRNIEAKFKLADLARAEKAARALGFLPAGLLRQRDTFFNVASGKLKLREEERVASLIFYRRQKHGDAIENHGGLTRSAYELMRSDYEIISIAEPERMRALLSEALGLLAEVRKERTLLLRDNVRLHLDRVAELGEFGEIEAVLADRADPERSRAAVDELLEALGIARIDLIEVSYFELLRAR
jgi:predicted adenylyl cyclase CyaB